MGRKFPWEGKEEEEEEEKLKVRVKSTKARKNAVARRRRKAEQIFHRLSITYNGNFEATVDTVLPSLPPLPVSV